MRVSQLHGDLRIFEGSAADRCSKEGLQRTMGVKMSFPGTPATSQIRRPICPCTYSPRWSIACNVPCCRQAQRLQTMGSLASCEPLLPSLPRCPASDSVAHNRGAVRPGRKELLLDRTLCSNDFLLMPGSFGYQASRFGSGVLDMLAVRLWIPLNL